MLIDSQRLKEELNKVKIEMGLIKFHLVKDIIKNLENENKEENKNG